MNELDQLVHVLPFPLLTHTIKMIIISYMYWLSMSVYLIKRYIRGYMYLTRRKEGY